MPRQPLEIRAARGLLVGLLGVSGLLGGCSHWRPETLPAHSVTRPSRSIPALASRPHPGLPIRARLAAPAPSLELAEKRGSYRIWDLSMGSAGDNGQPGRVVEARYFESTRPGVKRLVVILPIYGKSHYPSRKLARVLTRERDAHDVNVLLLTGETNLYRPGLVAAAESADELLDEIADTAERMRVTVVDILRLIDWAVSRPEIEPARIGVVGFSFSAILASLTMAVDERVGAGVFFMGGAHVHEIFAHCQGNQVAAARDALTRKLGWSQETFARRLEPILAPVEPLAYAAHLRGRPILLADSPLDRVIPEASRRDLWHALGRPERLILRFSHRTAFLSMTPLGANYSNRKIRRFFLENL